MPAIRTTHSRNNTLEVTTDAPFLPNLMFTAATPMGASFPLASAPLPQAPQSPLDPLAYAAPLDVNVKPALRLQTPPSFVRSLSPMSPASPCTDSSPVFSSPESSVAGRSRSRHPSRSRSPPPRLTLQPPAPKRRRSSTSAAQDPDVPRPKRGDPGYIKRPENAFILFRRDCVDKRMREMEEAEAAFLASGASSTPKPKRTRQADLSKMISQQWRELTSAEKAHWEGLAKDKKKEHERLYPDYVYRPQRAKKAKPGDPPSLKGKEVELPVDAGHFDLDFPLNPVRGMHGRSHSDFTHQTIRIPTVPGISPFEEPRQSSVGWTNPFMQPYGHPANTWPHALAPPTTYGAASLSPMSPTSPASPAETLPPVTPYDAPFNPPAPWMQSAAPCASSEDSSFIPAPEYPLEEQSLPAPTPSDMPELYAMPPLFEFSGEFVPTGMVDLLVDADFDISKIEAVTFDELQALEDGTHPLSTWDFSGIDLAAPPAPGAYDVFGNAELHHGPDPATGFPSDRFGGGW